MHARKLIKLTMAVKRKIKVVCEVLHLNFNIYLKKHSCNNDKLQIIFIS